jgi:phage terminase large subunit-like protein
MDPAGTGTGAEMGLVAAGRGADDDDYVLADWSKRVAGRSGAILAWELFRHVNADLLVYEDNFGKKWLAQVLTDAYRELQADDVFPPGGAVPMRGVTALHGKRLRAEPYAMRYEQGRVHHVGAFPDLEDQMATWEPDEQVDSPDRVDALVHAGMWLRGRERRRAGLAVPSGRLVPAGPGIVLPGVVAVPTGEYGQ